jgi:hypothetical protein
MIDDNVCELEMSPEEVWVKQTQPLHDLVREANHYLAKGLRGIAPERIKVVVVGGRLRFAVDGEVIDGTDDT